MTSLLDELIERLDTLPAAERAALAAEVMGETGEMVWVPQPGPQTEAYFSEADELFYGGQAGGGKMQPIDSVVLTPTGWQTIGSLKVGSKICASDGTVTEVIGVYPHKQKDIYRITMSDGGTTEAGLEHNWLAWPTHLSRKIGNIVTSGPASARKYTTAQIIQSMARNGQRFAIPVPDPVCLNVAGQLKGRGNFIGRPLPPYLLGILIGDGCVTTKNVGVTSADEEIIAYLSQIAGPDLRVALRVGNAAKSINFRGDFRNKLWADLKNLNLDGHRAVNKFIPRQYLFAPTPERWELLRGLMDTDGWVESDRAVYYTTISKRLAADVRHLVLSLGGVVSITEKMPSYIYKGEKKKGQKAYCLRIRMTEPDRCFRLSRKKEIAKEINHQSKARFIEKIEFSRVSDAVCIEVSHANSLYLTDDFIVTHNTDLLNGLALTAHTDSLILRRQSKEAMKLFDRLEQIIGHTDGRNMGTLSKWSLGERNIDIGGCQLEAHKQKFKGIPHDLIAFDEIPDFLYSQFVFIKTWNRSTIPGQRCRIVCAGNPPTTPEGLWVIEYWGPWLDPNHPNPARDGELRWFITDKYDRTHEVHGRGPHTIVHDDQSREELFARSRTFIRAKLEDNAYLRDTEYGANLDSLPSEIRAAYRDGAFDASIKDNPWQVIPTAWVKAAQERWTPKPPEGVPMCAMGIDPAQGGANCTTIAARYDGWYDHIISIPGVQTPLGSDVAAAVIGKRRNGAKPIVDCSGGYGGGVIQVFEANQIEYVAFKGGETATARTKDGKLKFKNKRAQSYWIFREALDPDQPGGSAIMLPPNPRLLADLTAITYSIPNNEIILEKKEEVAERIGRSPDDGDAVTMAWFDGAKGVTHGKMWKQNGRPSVVLGHQAQRRNR